MTSKVNICGIDTSLLPKLSNEELMHLMTQLKLGDEEAKKQFIIANLRLVLSVIKRFGATKENPDDLFQVGCVGLIKAINNFDISLNVKFSTYAVPMIVGEIKRFLRDCSCMRISRSIRDTAYKVLKTRENFAKRFKREPSLEEIARELNMSVKEVSFALDAMCEPVSMFAPVYKEGSDTVRVMDQIGDMKNNPDKWIENFALKDALKKLSEREKQILLMRYYLGKTQIEVSNEVGISQAQVSRLEKEAIKNMRREIN